MKEIYQVFNKETQATVFQGTFQECVKEMDNNPKKYEPVDGFGVRETLVKAGSK